MGERGFILRGKIMSDLQVNCKVTMVCATNIRQRADTLFLTVTAPGPELQHSCLNPPNLGRTITSRNNPKPKFEEGALVSFYKLTIGTRQRFTENVLRSWDSTALPIDLSLSAA